MIYSFKQHLHLVAALAKVDSVIASDRSHFLLFSTHFLWLKRRGIPNSKTRQQETTNEPLDWTSFLDHKPLPLWTPTIHWKGLKQNTTHEFVSKQTTITYNSHLVHKYNNLSHVKNRGNLPHPLLPVEMELIYCIVVRIRRDQYQNHIHHSSVGRKQPHLNWLNSIHLQRAIHQDGGNAIHIPQLKVVLEFLIWVQCKWKLVRNHLLQHLFLWHLSAVKILVFCRL